MFYRGNIQLQTWYILARKAHAAPMVQTGEFLMHELFSTFERVINEVRSDEMLGRVLGRDLSSSGWWH